LHSAVGILWSCSITIRGKAFFYPFFFDHLLCGAFYLSVFRNICLSPCIPSSIRFLCLCLMLM
jgi:hypothetical protein